MSGNVDGAVVSKNTIRASNQRCVVVHGTHNVTISENVAFDTMGHCYMTEDGGEIDNVFVRNLGANTRAATRVVRPEETDSTNPSTFWCSNPVNEWVGNVAAGGEANGYWFELQDSVKSPTSEMPLSAGMIPRRMPLKLFRDNVSHSYRRHGLRTYVSQPEPNDYSNEWNEDCTVLSLWTTHVTHFLLVPNLAASRFPPSETSHL
jgi:hypothetical protein